MQITQQHWTPQGGWKVVREVPSAHKPQLVLVFGGRALVSDQKMFDEIKGMYPKADVLMCSTAGEIIGTTVADDTISLTAIEFANTPVMYVETTIADAAESRAKGESLAKQLPQEGLAHALVFSDGLKVNGTALVGGLVANLPKDVVVTGGLVGDGADFKETAVGMNGPGKPGTIVLLGLYGDAITVGHGSLGGWDPFGPERTITKSRDNVLLEMDGKPALDLYKTYLGEEKAKELPGSGLLFPINMTVTRPDGSSYVVVRTLLAVDEKEQSMTFAGDMPEGAKAQLMRANFDRLVGGAEGAAKSSISNIGGATVELAILISCIGRKLVLKERVEEETEAVQSVVGEQAAMAGFYSYGEISPVAATEKQCELHNQTMTITTLSEAT